MSGKKNVGILNDLDVPPKIVSMARKGGFTTSWKVLQSSLGELKAKTGLGNKESTQLVRAAAEQCTPAYVTGLYMLNEEINGRGHHVITTGCRTIDAILGGGVDQASLTEVAGESGSGKTQLALNLAMRCQEGSSGGGVAYICTESRFPSARLRQMVEAEKDLTQTFNAKPYEDNILVHHLPEMDQLIDCARYQLPKLLSQHSEIRLVIVDSVAAVFRASEASQGEKSRGVQQLGVALRKISKSNVAVVAINQVSAIVGGDPQGEFWSDGFKPALGLAWSNLVTTRLMLSKTNFSAQPILYSSVESPKSFSKDQALSFNSSQDASIKMSKCLEDSSTSRARSFDLIFSPWRPRASCAFVVTQSGIRDANVSTLTLTKCG